MLQKIKRVVLPASLLALSLLLTACSGGGDSAPVTGATPTPVPNNPCYAFVANSCDHSVSSYVVDSATGRLKWIAKVAAGSNPNAVTVAPSDRYVYLANENSANVSQYTIAADDSLPPHNPRHRGRGLGTFLCYHDGQLAVTGFKYNGRHVYRNVTPQPDSTSLATSG